MRVLTEAEFIHLYGDSWREDLVRSGYLGKRAIHRVFPKAVLDSFVDEMDVYLGMEIPHVTLEVLVAEKGKVRLKDPIRNERFWNLDVTMFVESVNAITEYRRTKIKVRLGLSQLVDVEV